MFKPQLKLVENVFISIEIFKRKGYENISHNNM